MYAEVEVIVDHADDVLVIPVDAIVYKDAQPIVYTAQADGTVKETKVTLGLNDGDQYVVTEGLKARRSDCCERKQHISRWCKGNCGNS